MWTIKDRKGQRVGGVGTKDEPFTVNDLVCFERCITNPSEPPKWRMKEKWRAEQKQANEATQEVTDAT